MRNMYGDGFDTEDNGVTGLAGFKAYLSYRVALRTEAQLDYIRQAFPLQHTHMVDARHFLQEEHPVVISAQITSFAGEIAEQPKRAREAAD